MAEPVTAKTLTVKTISMKTSILLAYIFFVAIVAGEQTGIVYFKIQDGFRYTLTLCIITTVIMMYLITINTNLTTFSFKFNPLEISKKNHPLAHISAKDIKSYAIYIFFLRKWGYIVHFRTKTKRYYYYAIPWHMDKMVFSDKKNFIKIKSLFEKLTNKPSERTGADWCFLALFIIIIFIIPPTLGIFFILHS